MSVAMSHGEAVARCLELMGERDKLRAEVARLTDAYLAEHQCAVDALSKLSDAEDLLTSAMEYARHSEGCSMADGPEYRCRCGYLALEQEVAAWQAKQNGEHQPK